MGKYIAIDQLDVPNFVDLLFLVLGTEYTSCGELERCRISRGPMTFNALPDELRDPTVNMTTFRRL